MIKRNLPAHWVDRFVADQVMQLRNDEVNKEWTEGKELLHAEEFCFRSIETHPGTFPSQAGSNQKEDKTKLLNGDDLLKLCDA